MLSKLELWTQARGLAYCASWVLCKTNSACSVAGMHLHTGSVFWSGQPSPTSHCSAGGVHLPTLCRVWRAACPSGILTFEEVCQLTQRHSVIMEWTIEPERVWAELHDLVGGHVSEVSGMSPWQQLSTGASGQSCRAC